MYSFLPAHVQFGAHLLPWTRARPPPKLHGVPRAGDLPPSLSLPSPQAVSMDVSQPAPLQPSWQTQCQPFRSRVHLPLPLHKPGQPSARQSIQHGALTVRSHLQSHTLVLLLPARELLSGPPARRRPQHPGRPETFPLEK